VIYRDAHVTALWDMFPVNPGHALIVPNRHVASWFDATEEERAALLRGVDICKREIERLHPADGYNVGFNDGAAAGQTVFHLHVHVIPRLKGDVADPRGGIRFVLPERARYWDAGTDQASGRAARSLVTGGSVDPLLPDLKFHLAKSRAADICVAFTLRSGIELLQDDLQDLLDRKGRLRVLTGDYLDATDPDALLRLTDLKASPGQFECRVFSTQAGGLAGTDGTSFHPKSYLFRHADGSSAAFVGSSNLSATALQNGVEWNYRLSGPGSTAGLVEVQSAFDRLFQHPRTVPLNDDWIQSYRARRKPRTFADKPGFEEDDPATPYQPHAIQSEALSALKETRERGHIAGLVVLATGLGKTWLSAFDSASFKRVLFVAHRDEILQQARNTFRHVRPGARLGIYSGVEKSGDAEVLFASVQTLSRKEHLEQFAPDAFDYIVIDEFHHANARTYRKLINHFRPKFMLGLTATPERSDGADLLALCGDNLVYRCDVADGITRGQLCPFRYYGVPDTIDYTNIPWRSTRFDEEALTRAAATQERAKNALEQYRKHAGVRTIAFCVSRQHADFMASYFEENGVSAAAVHSGENSAPRALSLERLREGTLQVLCAVDMFNEGVDIPDLDTVMMLRPTESRIIWLQQFGRGLRKGAADKKLTVIDYIGNHKSFLVKAMALFNLNDDRHALSQMLDDIERGEVDLPPGCDVTYELEAIDIYRQLLPTTGAATLLLTQRYQDFLDQNGTRPTAVELFREGYLPRTVQQSHGSWLKFVEAQGGLSAGERAVLLAYSRFLTELESTQMTKSYKMLMVLSMLNIEKFPGPVSLSEIGVGISGMATRDARVAHDLGDNLNTPRKLVSLLERNPVAAWTGEASGGFFRMDESGFRFRDAVAADHLEAFCALVQEVCEWRLEEYFRRATARDGVGFVLHVTHSNRKPILMLPDRGRFSGLPKGWTSVRAGDDLLDLNFVKVAVNVARRGGSSANVLAEVLRRWFGDTAGLPGTSFKVRLTEGEVGWVLGPVRDGGEG
jgi:superfamily II DNA or RNA helicase/diadenosine tetraphosphate (Ap4A) HIT family hydrolase